MASMSANVPAASIIEPPQFFLSMEHRVFEPARLVMARQRFSRKIRLPACLSESIEERSTLIFLSFSNHLPRVFLSEIGQRQGKQANRRRYPKANVN
jgi:hypothetical protein